VPSAIAATIQRPQHVALLVEPIDRAVGADQCGLGRAHDGQRTRALVLRQRQRLATDDRRAATQVPIGRPVEQAETGLGRPQRRGDAQAHLPTFELKAAAGRRAAHAPAQRARVSAQLEIVCHAAAHRGDPGRRARRNATVAQQAPRTVEAAVGESSIGQRHQIGDAVGGDHGHRTGAPAGGVELHHWKPEVAPGPTRMGRAGGMDGAPVGRPRHDAQIAAEHRRHCELGQRAPGRDIDDLDRLVLTLARVGTDVHVGIGDRQTLAVGAEAHASRTPCAHRKTLQRCDRTAADPKGLHRAVESGCGGQAVRRHREAEHRALVAHLEQRRAVERERTQAMLAGERGQQHAAIGGPREIAHVARARVDRAQQRTGLQIEQIDRVRAALAASGAAHRHQRPARMDRHAVQATALGTERQRPQHMAQLAAGRIPDARGAIVRRGDHPAACRVDVDATHRCTMRALFDHQQRLWLRCRLRLRLQ
jgi:hypothetical protein